MAEQRKLIRLGNSSFAIALPKGWVDNAGLKKGDQVFITPNSNGELMISPELKRINDHGKESFINILGKDEGEIARDLISAYISGAKKISVTNEKEELKLAKKVAKRFLNLEFIEDDGKKAIFKDMLDIEGMDINNFIKRMNNNIKEMFSILLSICEDGKKTKERLEEIEEIDKDITKFYFLIWRIMSLGLDNPAIQINLKTTPKLFVLYFWIAYNLEQIGDEIKGIARNSGKADKNGREDLLKTLNLIIERYGGSMKSFFDKDKKTSKAIILKTKETVRMCEKLSKTKGYEIIAEKLLKINADIHNNSKMIFYEF